MPVRLEYLRGIAVGVIVGALMSGCTMVGVGKPTREEVLQRILPSAVQVIIEQQEGRRVRTGSGVVLATRGTDEGRECFILTSGHTVSGIMGQKEIYVVFGRDRGDTEKSRASILAYRDTPEVDLALLQTRFDRCVAAQPGRRPILGESVWVIGFPWGRHMTLGSGIVSQINADDNMDRETASRLMVDASVSYGSSGGGVYEAGGGSLLGVVEGYSTARVTAQGATPAWYIDVPVPGQTYVTPLSDVRRFLAQTGYGDLVGATNGRLVGAEKKNVQSAK
jgi:S1-C subfamily serine protease